MEGVPVEGLKVSLSSGWKCPYCWAEDMPAGGLKVCFLEDWNCPCWGVLKWEIKIKIRISWIKYGKSTSWESWCEIARQFPTAWKFVCWEDAACIYKEGSLFVVTLFMRCISEKEGKNLEIRHSLISSLTWPALLSNEDFYFFKESFRGKGLQHFGALRFL